MANNKLTTLKNKNNGFETKFENQRGVQCCGPSKYGNGLVYIELRVYDTQIQLKQIFASDKGNKKTKKKKKKQGHLALLVIAIHKYPDEIKYLHFILTMLTLVTFLPYPLLAVHLYDPAFFLCALTRCKKCPEALNSFTDTLSFVQVIVGFGSPDA